MNKRTILSMAIALLALAASALACSFGGQATPTPAGSGAVIDDGTSGPEFPTPISTSSPEESSNAVQAASYGLALYLDADPSALILVSAYETVFPDTALDCPRPGETVEAEATAGYTVILSDGEREYEVHTSIDGLRVRCLSDDLRPGDAPSKSGIVATIDALESQEYGTLASLLPATVYISTYPEVEEALSASTFVAQLRDIWLGPADLQVDLNSNVLGLMPSLELPPSQIPVYSTGWGASRDTDGILFFDLSGETPTLLRVLFIPVGQKAIAYAETGPGKEGSALSLTFVDEETGYAIRYPQGWITFTLEGKAHFQPQGEPVAITVGSWQVPDAPAQGQSFRRWIESTLAETVDGFDGITTMEPIWATSGQAGYVLAWQLRRADGGLQTSGPIALFEYPQADLYGLEVSVLSPGYQSIFREMVSTITLPQSLGVPGDMNVYHHDGLGYRIQFPAVWELQPSPLGAAFRPPGEATAVTIGPWPVAEGPAAGQSFEDWVATAPADQIDGYGEMWEMTPLYATGEATGTGAQEAVGYIVTWRIPQAGGAFELSDPTALFPFRRQWEETVYHALAVGQHVPAYTETFERMLSTLVREKGNTVGMVYIPAGPFVRGSTDDEIAALPGLCGSACRGGEFNDEGPQRTITLKGYYIDRTEVAVAQFKEFVEATGYPTTAEQKGDAVQYTWRAFDWPDRQDHPVRWISWDDANAYCQWAGRRLPTEAEWEKAGRGEDTRTWPWGSAWDDGIVPHGDTAPVDLYAQGASPYGVLGMAGGVWEWVADWHDAAYYSSSPDTDPPGPPSSPDKVLRGGGFNNNRWVMRTAHRHYGGAMGYSTDHGFRCAADV